MNKICFLVCGQLGRCNIDRLIDAYEEVKEHVIISTWETEDPRSIELLKKKGFKVLLNKLPLEFDMLCNHSEFKSTSTVEDRLNLKTVWNPTYHISYSMNHQIHTLKCAYEFAVTLGYDYFIKTRTDLYIYNISKLLEIIQRKTSYDYICLKYLNLCGISTPSDLFFCASKNFLPRVFTYVTPSNVETYRGMTGEHLFHHNFFKDIRYTNKEIYPEICKELYNNHVQIIWKDPPYEWDIVKDYATI